MIKPNWRWLNENLSARTEAEVLELLEAERRVHKRVRILERLHQRYTMLRAARERVELMKEITQ